jgi:dTDP-4-dehydrorhamnose 3,5-epimerase
MLDVAAAALPDVKIFTPKRFDDERGYFMETFSAARLDPHIDGLVFVQDNESYSRQAFTLRGLHYQAPPHAQDKLVRVIRGAIFDVAVDARKGSPTYGKWVGETLTAENRKQLFAPKGFLHGFMTLEPDTLVAYKVTNYYHAASDGAVFWASPELAITWPGLHEKAVISAKDAAAPLFSDFVSPF